MLLFLIFPVPLSLSLYFCLTISLSLLCLPPLYSPLLSFKSLLFSGTVYSMYFPLKEHNLSTFKNDRTGKNCTKYREISHFRKIPKIYEIIRKFPKTVLRKKKKKKKKFCSSKQTKHNTQFGTSRLYEQFIFSLLFSLFFRDGRGITGGYFELC